MTNAEIKTVMQPFWDADKARAKLEADQIEAAGGTALLDGEGELEGLGSYAEDEPETHFQGMSAEEIAALRAKSGQ
jgi:hypothetical protein